MSLLSSVIFELPIALFSLEPLIHFRRLLLISFNTFHIHISATSPWLQMPMWPAPPPYSLAVWIYDRFCHCPHRRMPVVAVCGSNPSISFSKHSFPRPNAGNPYGTTHNFLIIPSGCNAPAEYVFSLFDDPYDRCAIHPNVPTPQCIEKPLPQIFPRPLSAHRSPRSLKMCITSPWICETYHGIPVK